MEDFQIINLFHQRNPDATRETGVMWDEERTEDGVCIYGSPLVPKPYRDHFTITLRVKSLDCYWFFDLSRGAYWYHEEAGIEPVAVTIPRSE